LYGGDSLKMTLMRIKFTYNLHGNVQQKKRCNFFVYFNDAGTPKIHKTNKTAFRFTETHSLDVEISATLNENAHNESLGFNHFSFAVCMKGDCEYNKHVEMEGSNVIKLADSKENLGH